MKDLTDYESFKRILDLKDYVELKTDPLSFLVKGKGTLKVRGKTAEGRETDFDVQVFHPSDRENPWDCKVGNFSINRFFRTKKGRTGEKYESLSLMLSEVGKGMKRHFGTKAVGFIITKERSQRR